VIVVMEPEAPESAVESVISYLVHAGFDVHRSSGQTRTILGVVGDVTGNDVSVVRELDAVAEVVRVSEPYRLASRRFRQQSTLVEGPWGTIGGERPWIAIEPIGAPSVSADRNQADANGPPSTELPYEVAAGRPFDAAVTRSRLAPDGVGALACLSLHPQPAAPQYPIVFVERAPSWGANAWIGAAEKELERGEANVVLLEAGGEYPNGARTLEVAAIARAKIRTHLPIVVDAPTIAQRARYLTAVACAAVGAGADGVVLRVWVGREGEIPRVPATLRWEEAMELADRLRAVGAAVRR
jgi:3-deoxy-7-phosphoheptulonate synthase